MSVVKCSNKDCVAKKSCLRFSENIINGNVSMTIIPAVNTVCNFTCDSFISQKKDFRNSRVVVNLR